jgi:hypothetical protein
MHKEHASFAMHDASYPERRCFLFFSSYNAHGHMTHFKKIIRDPFGIPTFFLVGVQYALWCTVILGGLELLGWLVVNIPLLFAPGRLPNR